MKIKSIRKVGKARVINLTVHKNHTFVTGNGIVTHNCDNITKDSQASFRSFLDEYSENCRFIFTGNYKERIIQPLLDRLENYDFALFDRKAMAKPVFTRMCEILDNEGIKYDQKDIVTVIGACYPRIRSMVNMLFKMSRTGTFVLDKKEIDENSTFDAVMALLRPDKYYDLITAVNQLNSPDSLYSYLYKNLERYFKPNSFPNAIITLAKYQEMSASVRDKNLNLSACLSELMMIKLQEGK